jgi:hypothetical protein
LTTVFLRRATIGGAVEIVPRRSLRHAEAGDWTPGAPERRGVLGDERMKGERGKRIGGGSAMDLRDLT